MKKKGNGKNATHVARPFFFVNGNGKDMEMEMEMDANGPFFFSIFRIGGDGRLKKNKMEKSHGVFGRKKKLWRKNHAKKISKIGTFLSFFVICMENCQVPECKVEKRPAIILYVGKFVITLKKIVEKKRFN